MAKTDKNLLLVAQEIKLVKILAGNNKKLRDRTIKKLSKWLSDRSNAAPLTEDSLLRIWKGLFYAMWMSDKPLIQEECAEKIASLVHLNDISASLLFFKCFLQTMVSEWFGIDQHRIDKFLMLVRRVLRQMFEVLHKNGWQDDDINKFREIFNQTAFKIGKNTAISLCLHLNDIYLEELAKVSKGTLSDSQVLELIQPFAQQMARVDDKRQIKHIVDHIFKHLINQTDIAIDYKEKFHAWKRQGFVGGNIDALEAVEDEDEETDNIEIEENLDNLPKDPRAGKVDVVLPQLKFDPLEVKKLLEEVKFKKYTTAIARKEITKLIKHFQLLSEGTYPLGLTQIEIVDKDKETSVKKSLKRLEQFENTLKHDSKKAKQKALKHKKAQEILLKQVEEPETQNNKPPKQKRTKTIEEFIEKNKQPKQKRARTIEEFIEESEGHILNKINKKKRKLNQQNGTNPPKKNKIGENNSEEQVPIKFQNYFRRNSGMWTVDEYEIPESPKSDTNKSDWEKPLQNGETEIFVVSKKYKKKLKGLAKSEIEPAIKMVDDFTKKLMTTPKNKSSVVKNPFSSSAEKRIKFSNKIHEQEFRDHEKNIKNSPIIPYDGSKQPTKSLLKPSPFNSPINPFYGIN